MTERKQDDRRKKTSGLEGIAKIFILGWNSTFILYNKSSPYVKKLYFESTKEIEVGDGFSRIGIGLWSSISGRPFDALPFIPGWR